MMGALNSSTEDRQEAVKGIVFLKSKLEAQRCAEKDSINQEMDADLQRLQ